MPLSAKSKRLLIGSVSNGSAASNTRRGRPLAKLSNREGRSNKRLEMSRSVSRRRRDSARLAKPKKLVKLKRKPSASLKKKLKMTMAKPTRTRVTWVKTTVITKMTRGTRLRIQPNKNLGRSVIRMRVTRQMMSINLKPKRLRLINLKRILEKTPESMRIPSMLRIADVAKNAIEAAKRKVEAVVAMDVESRIWSTDPRPNNPSHSMRWKKRNKTEMLRLTLLPTRRSKLRTLTRRLMTVRLMERMLRPLKTARMSNKKRCLLHLSPLQTPRPKLILPLLQRSSNKHHRA